MKKYFSKSDIARYRTPIDIFVREVRNNVNYHNIIDEYLCKLNPLIGNQKVEIPLVIDGKEVIASQGTITVNIEAINKYAHDGKLKELYTYITSCYITKGRGFMYRKHLLKALCLTTNTRFKPMLEIEQFLLKEGLWEYNSKHDIIKVISKNKLPKRLEIRNNKSIQIPFARLLNYKGFVDHFICISHLKIQKTFEWALPKIKNNRNCPFLNQKVNFDGEPANISKVGVSIRKLMQHLPFSYRTIQQALKRYTKRLFNDIDKLSIEDFKKRYSLSFFKKNPKYSFAFENGIMIVRYALGSKNNYCMQSCLKSRSITVL